MVKINRKELRDALEKVRPGLAGQKELVQQSASFAFMGDRVVTYNDEISISHPVKSLDIRGAVRADVLFGYLNKLSTDEIDVDYTDEQIKISAGRATAGLVLEKEVKLPVQEIGEVGEWQAIPEGLVDAIRFCIPACSRDLSRPALSCVHIAGTNVEGSDGFRITRYTLSKPFPISEVMLPILSASALVNYDVTEVAEGEGWIHFKSDEGTVFSARTIAVTYPDTEPFLDFEGPELHLPKSLVKALDRAQVIAGPRQRRDGLQCDPKGSMAGSKNEYAQDTRAELFASPCRWSS